MKWNFFTISIVALLILGCATTGDGIRRGSSYEIIEEEIRNCNAETAYEIIQRLRPNLLFRASNARGGDMFSQTDVVVYVDRVRVGGLSSLYTINAEHVSRIEYLRASEANMRFGANHNAGAFLITTR